MLSHKFDLLMHQHVQTVTSVGTMECFWEEMGWLLCAFLILWAASVLLATEVSIAWKISTVTGDLYSLPLFMDINFYIKVQKVFFKILY